MQAVLPCMTLTLNFGTVILNFSQWGLNCFCYFVSLITSLKTSCLSICNHKFSKTYIYHVTLLFKMIRYLYLRINTSFKHLDFFVIWLPASSIQYHFSLNGQKSSKLKMSQRHCFLLCLCAILATLSSLFTLLYILTVAFFN